MGLTPHEHSPSKENDETIRAIVESIQDPFYTVDGDWKITYVNEEARRAFNKTAEEMIGCALWDVFSISRGSDAHRELTRAMHERAVVRFETVSAVLDRWVEVRAYPTATGGLSVSFRDITERKKAEQALRESDERLRLFIEHAPAALAMFDRHMRYLSVSRRWLVDYGLGDRDLRGMSHYEVFPEIGDEWKQVHRRAMEGEVVRADADRFVRADGRVQWLRWEVRPWRDAAGGIAGIVVFTEDISALVLANETIRADEHWLRVAEEAAGAGTWLWDLRSNRNVWSDEAWKLYGLEKGGSAPPYEAWRDAILPEDRDKTIAAVDAAVQSGREMTVEFRIRHADGRVRHLLSRGRPLFDESGKPEKYLGIVLDITEQEKAADALRDTELELREAQRIARVGSWRWDAKTDAFFASEELMRMFGRADLPSFRQQRGIMYPPEEWERLNAAVNETLRTGVDCEIELKALRGDGASIWISARGAAVRDSTGEVVGLRGTTQDITERKRAEEAMRESEARVYSLTNNLPESLVYQIEAGPDGARRFTFLSDAVKRLFGCTPDEGLADAGRIYGRILPEDLEPLAMAEEKALADLTPFRAEVRFRTVSGGVGWAYLTSAHRLRSDGSIVWDGILVDVTRRRRTEEALRVSEERLRAHMDNSPLAIVEFNHEFRIKRWSQQAERLFGWSAEEVLGRKLRELPWVHEEDLESVARESAGLQSGERPRSFNVNRNYRKDGSVVYCEWYSSALYAPDGRLVSVLSQVLDVTARKEAEQALRESEQQLRAMYEQNPAMVVLSDLADGSILEVNEGFTRMLGFSTTEALGRTPVELGIFPDAEARQRLVDQIREAGSVRSLETSVRTKSGAHLTGLLSSKVLYIGDKKCLLTLMADITDRKRTETALEEANLRLREADRRKNDFLAVLSHELRNPLAPIRNSTYILERAAPGSERARRALAVIDRQAAQLARLVDDLLDVTRITRNKIQLQRQTLELNELARHSLEDQRSLFERAEVHLELVPSPEPVFVSGDWNRLAQVIGNLLQNSAKFTGPGGTATVSIHTDVAAKRAVIQVADTGVGMAPDMIARLFEPFSQADSSLDRSKGGLGLGLALVKGLVELHGGDVGAYSAGLGQGSELIVRLPLAAKEVATPESGSLAASHRRVLVIEDNIDAADSLAEALGLGGHDVVVAYNGPDGIAKARELRPDVVLCDIGLPGMDGYEVARTFRADSSLEQTCLVALTGYALPEDIQRAAEAGFDHHLAKPPNLEKLERLLAEVPTLP